MLRGLKRYRFSRKCSVQQHSYLRGVWRDEDCSRSKARDGEIMGRKRKAGPAPRPLPSTICLHAPHSHPL
ncbi:hypothetical protein E2C01_093048 [Portunus trituberculatus]|uniref:Uncharacterized protein n=1 Tax=Portunus trituberculatus TaxID=210409 RepID=A0A5B7JLU0_PORTR|nr:hypothetical protein [Portunus trituberculatus]